MLVKSFKTMLERNFEEQEAEFQSAEFESRTVMHS